MCCRSGEYKVGQAFVLPHPESSHPVYDGDHVYLIECMGKSKDHGACE